MFAILTKAVDGRRFDRYFREFKNARTEMMNEVEGIIKKYGCKRRNSTDRLNVEKGIYELEETIVTDDDTRFVWAILGGYFQD